MATLARQLDFEFPAGYEVAGYLDHQRWGFFSVLSREQGTSKARQSTYTLNRLPEVLKLATADRSRDYWITQAVFSAFNRRKVNLASVGLAFVDLDYYKFPHLICLDSEKVLRMVLDHCLKMNIPEPSIVVDSGKGLQIKWFHEPLPKKVLPRWEAMQRYLVTMFEGLGGDHHARDVSRVLRIVHTINQKNGNMVQVLWVNNRFEVDQPVSYVFNELIGQIIPAPNPAQAPQKRKAQSAVVKPLRPHKNQFTLNSLNWTRLCDLQNLIKIRGGDVGEGMREPMAFYLCNFYGLRYHQDLATRPADDWAEFRQLCLQSAPHWSASKIREKTSNLYQLTRQMAGGETVAFRGREYPPLYTPKSQTLIDTFQITDDELKQMDTILSESEKKRRNSESHKKRRHEEGAVARDQYEKERVEKTNDLGREVVRLKDSGLKQKEIAEKLGISKGRVSQLVKKFNGVSP